ncbi:hypothetical protein VCHA50P415_10812 [Vibrio chagasii]|nr:hypothetical protein VCHA31O71_10329 [Vibrio chagasii]CAH6852430.1 hypothetical protein VCHA36O163_10706 [Vibrio chagasii]CAH6868879.1 hypothetical protein VCHA34P126_10803 [Vibrio chagasii]CAH6992878.1 hypothetical protein VCHA40O231_10059 [Vibrio chagasii]CAH7018525.1 hypothetical protein VCHA34O109_50063 [Vibrio chagasii]
MMLFSALTYRTLLRASCFLLPFDQGMRGLVRSSCLSPHIINFLVRGFYTENAQKQDPNHTLLQVTYFYYNTPFMRKSGLRYSQKKQLK